jgi:predicted PurR-regulated permease PerM
VLIGNSVNDFTRSIPTYESQLMEKFESINVLLNKIGISVPDDDLRKLFNPGAAMKLVAKTLNSLGNALTNGFMIILTVIFILLEVSSFPKKINKIFEGNKKAMIPFDKFSENIKRYMAIKTIISLGTGLAVFMMLSFMKLKYAFLWGVLAFILNYIPNIGSIIAAVPPILLSLIQLGPIYSVAIAIGFLIVILVAGNVIEPKFMGKGLGLSTLVVFLSLIFWGWVLGPVGMLLSVPLTVMVKIAVDSSESFKWLSILLGPENPEKN